MFSVFWLKTGVYALLLLVLSWYGSPFHSGDRFGGTSPKLVPSWSRWCNSRPRQQRSVEHPLSVEEAVAAGSRSIRRAESSRVAKPRGRRAASDFM